MMFKDVENNNLETDVFQNVEILFRNGKLLVGFRNYDDWEIFREQTGIHHSYYQNEIMCFEIGIQTAFLLNFSDNDLYGQIPNDQSIPFNKIDLGAFIGMNYHLTDNILLNSRISNSILPVRPHASGAIYQLNRGQYNSVLSFTLHYII